MDKFELGTKGPQATISRNVLTLSRVIGHFINAGQFPLKDLESREIKLSFVWAVKKQVCLEKCMKLKPVDCAAC